MKKLLTYSVVIATVIWSLGLAAVVPVASAAYSPVAGDLVKLNATNAPAVYYVGSDLKRYPFPDETIFWTWYGNEGNWGAQGIKKITEAELTAMPIATDVLLRPGVKLFKFAGRSGVFALGADNTKYPIDGPTTAASLFGSTWTKKVISLNAFLEKDYPTTGSALTATSKIPDGSLVKFTGDTTVYYISGGAKQAVDAAALTANGFKATAVNTLPASAATSYTTGSAITARINKVATVAGPESGAITPVVTTGDLTVSLSAATPAASNVVKAVDGVVFTKANFKASASGQSQVNSITIGRTGLGSTGDFSSVTLYDGSTKLGSTRTSWDSNDQIIFNIPNGWIIPAGQTKELTVVGKLGNAGSYNALGVIAVGTSAGTVGGLPVYGQQMSGVTVTVGTVTITNQGTSVTKRIGSSGVTMAQFRLAVDSVENGTLKSVTLKNKAATSNAADTDVANLTLYHGTTKVAGPVQMTSDKVTFVLDTSVAIAKSQNEDFKVVGDIVNGSGNTVEYVLDATTDLTVSGSTYNTSLTVASTGYDAATEGAIITISGAQLNIGYTGVDVDTMANKTNVPFGTITLSAGNTDVKITNLVLGITETEGGTGGVWDVDNLKLVAADGSAYSGAETAVANTTASAETWTFSDEIYLAKGTSKAFDVKGDIASDAGNLDTYKLTMTVNTSNLTAETVPGGTSVSSFSVGSIDGKIVTVKAPYLTVKNIGLNVGNATVNQKDVVLFDGTMEATAGNVTVSKLAFVANSANKLLATNWSDIGLFTKASDGSYTLLQNITNSDLTDDALTFDSFSTVVTKGSSNVVEFVVKGTVAATISSTQATEQIKLATVTAKDADNNTAIAYDGNGTAVSTSNYLTTTRIITLGGTGELEVGIQIVDTGFNKDRYLLAGTGDWVGKMQVKALYEDIKIKDLKLANVSTAAADSVSSVCIYSDKTLDSTKKVGCTTLGTNNIAYFQSLNAVVPQGTNNWYIYVSTNPMSDAPSGTADTGDVIRFGMVTTTANMAITASGVNSGNSLTASTVDAAGNILFDKDSDGTYGDNLAATTTMATKSFTVVGSKIAAVDLVSSYGSTAIAGTAGKVSVLSTGFYNLAILKVTNTSNANKTAAGADLKLALASTTFNVTKSSITALDYASIERIGGSGATSTMVITGVDAGNETTGRWYAPTLRADLGNDALIAAGDTAYFLVKGEFSTVDATATTQEVDWIKLDMNTLDTAATQNISWFDGFDTSYGVANRMDTTLLDYTNISGIKITE